MSDRLEGGLKDQLLRPWLNRCPIAARIIDHIWRAVQHEVVPVAAGPLKT